jgi:RND family efflux transporter MFP subunit
MGESLELVRLVKVKSEEWITMKRILAVLPFGALLLLGCAMVSGCSKDNTTNGTAVAATRPTRDNAVNPAATTDYYETSGPIVVENQVEILAQHEGVVAQIFVETGKEVKKGDVLAQLDDRQMRAEREVAQSKVKGLEANMKAWESEAKIFQSDYDRDQEMFKANLITAKQLEHSKFKVNSSTYELEREKQNLAAAIGELQTLDLRLEKTKIIAPFSGVVARRYINQGQKISTNDKTFWITETSPLYVQFMLPESYLGHINKGQEITVLASSREDEKHIAKIRIVSPVADPSSGTIEVRAELEGAGRSLMPGANAIVRVAKIK